MFGEDNSAQEGWFRTRLMVRVDAWVEVVELHARKPGGLRPPLRKSKTNARDVWAGMAIDYCFW